MALYNSSVGVACRNYAIIKCHTQYLSSRTRVACEHVAIHVPEILLSLLITTACS